MSIERALTATYFKRDRAGRTIVYPLGMLGRGYFVPDVATEQRIRSKLTRGFIALFIIMLGQSLVFEIGSIENWPAETWAIMVAELIVLLGGYMFWLKRLVRGFAPAAERMGLTESLQLRSEAWPRWLLRGLVWSQIVGAIWAGIDFVMMPSLMTVVLAVLSLPTAALYQTMLRFSRP